jgi:antitoxin component YwqK of YwqJK toxin-antitoxin module
MTPGVHRCVAAASLAICGWLGSTAQAADSVMPPADPPSASDIGPCPEGTARAEKVTPGGRELTCEKPSHRRAGPALAWHANGAIASQGEYVSDLRDGWWRTWDENGVLTSEIEYDGGLWIARRRPASEGRGRPSVPGDSVHPCPEGAVIATPPASREQWCERLRADGAFVREGPWVTLSGTDVWERGGYRNGRRHGEFVQLHGREPAEDTKTYADGEVVASTSWYPSGKKRRETKVGDDGLETQRSWRRDGSLSEEEVLRGKERLRRTFWFHNGAKSGEESWSGGKKNGVQRAWWPNGELRKEGEMSAGRDIGVWHEWSPDCVLTETTTYSPGGRSSREVVVVWPEDPPGWPFAKVPPQPLSQAPRESLCPPPAKPFSQETPQFTARGCAIATAEVAVEAEYSWNGSDPIIRARNGRLHGPLRIWDAQGREQAQAEFRDGAYDGRVIFWREDGSLSRIVTYAAGVEAGSWANWYPNGAHANCGGYLGHKQKDGVWISCSQTGHCSKREEYRAGLADGLWVEWWDDGHKRSEAGHSAGQLDGPYTTWDNEGQLVTQGQYRAGKKTGRWVESGSDGTWLDGERDGAWAFRNSDGGIEEQGRYERGRRVGEWKRYGDRGELEAQGSYAWCASPPEISQARWPDGRMIQEGGHDGCKKGTWSYWTDNGHLYGRFDHDETDPKKRPHIERPAAAASQ